MKTDNDDMYMKIARTVAQRSRLVDKEEAVAIALLGIAKGLNSYEESKGTRLSTYLYSCAKFECWEEWRRQRTKKRGGGVTIVSLEELQEKGIEI